MTFDWTHFTPGSALTGAFSSDSRRRSPLSEIGDRDRTEENSTMLPFTLG